MCNQGLSRFYHVLANGGFAPGTKSNQKHTAQV